MARGWRVYKYLTLLRSLRYKHVIRLLPTSPTRMGNPSGTIPLYSNIYHLIIVLSISLVLLQPQLFNLNLLAGFSPYLPTISRSSFKQGGAWISIVLMQQLLILIREHPIHPSLLSHAPP